MKAINHFPSVLMAALALAGVAYGQVPSTNDNSTVDGNANTGSGRYALAGPSDTADASDDAAFGWSALGSEAGGSNNTGIGAYALFSDTTGVNNTAVGYNALGDNYSGENNTATGANALAYSDHGHTGISGNTADGADALDYNYTGQNNTAIGYQALQGSATITDVTGSSNAGMGAAALYSYSTGSDNTASGYAALYSTTTGSYNTASGYEALYSATIADYNTASGYQALYKTNAVSNTASGYQALYDDTSGAENTAMGVHALQDNSSGSSNIGIGYHGGINLTNGSNNIDIGSPGVAAESGVIRIGTITGITSTQSAAYIAGVYGKTSSGGLPIVINSNGLLGTTTSSARFKTAIEPMGSNTAKLQQLRPVTFHLKSDPTGAVQYGLIAEEVATIYPELVVRDANGRIDGVRYDELAPILLNEMQKQQQKIAAQDANIRQLKLQQKQFAAHAAQLRELQRQLADMHAALIELQAKNELVAQR
jgi:Chaperone of endosialidase